MTSKSPHCRIIALFNQAGGVAKTTLTQNLGYHLSQREQHVLLIDLDPQASLTKFMGLTPKQLEQTLYNALVEQYPLPIHSNIHGIDLVPANRKLSGVDTELINDPMRFLCLKDALETAIPNYDFILLDCPPSLGFLSSISLIAATHVLVPIETHLKAYEGTDELLETIKNIKEKPNRQLKIAGFVPTRYAKSNSADVRALAAINENMQAWGKVFPPIPRATAFVDASEERSPLAIYEAKHPAVAILEQIAQFLESLT